MRKRLMAIGNSLGLIIEKPILELLSIDRETELEIRTDGEALIIRPAKAAKRRRMLDSASRMMDAHDESLRKLAE